MSATRRQLLQTTAGAASVHYFHGKQSPDNAVIRQAREALSKPGGRSVYRSPGFRIVACQISCSAWSGR